MKKMIDDFKEMVKVQSEYKKWCHRNTIEFMYSYFDQQLNKKKYGNTLNVDPLELALFFYRENFNEYYPLIEQGFKTGRIKIVDNQDSYTTIDGISIISRVDTDEFFYRIIHELAHYIDCNSEERIISKEWDIFSEITPFYVEKRFESFYRDIYPELTQTRINNRLFFEAKMLKVIKAMLRYEDYYKDNGSIDEIINEDEVKRIMSYNSSNVVNYLLRYPVCNLLSTYMVNNGIGLGLRLEDRLKDISLISLMEDSNIKKTLYYSHKV